MYFNEFGIEIVGCHSPHPHVRRRGNVIFVDEKLYSQMKEQKEKGESPTLLSLVMNKAHEVGHLNIWRGDD